MDLSFQLYSARNFQPWDKVFSALADYGYAQVEGFGGMFDDADGLANLLQRTGLRMDSAHFGIDQLEDDFEQSLAIMNKLGIKTVFCPYLDEPQRPSTAEGWQEFAHRLAAIGEKLASHNIAFGWHNHDFEFKALGDGQLPMDILLRSAPSINWEADIAWIVVGGHDPLTWIEKYGDRMTAIHVKDRAPEGQNLDQDGWCDVGDGVIDWAAIMHEVRTQSNTEIFCVEHDNPSDVFAFAQNSINNIRKL